MEKLKDFIYEHSDLFFTAVIVLVVGVVVSSSLYGWFNIKDEENKYKEMNEVIHEEQSPDQEASAGKEPDSSETEPSGDGSQAQPANDQAQSDDQQQKPENPEQQPSAQQSGAPSGESPEASIKNIEIAPGSSSSSIASALENQGLIKSADEFLNLLVSSGKETKLKAGTFAITQGSTDSQIIDILTK